MYLVCHHACHLHCMHSEPRPETVLSGMLQDMELGSHPDLESVPEDDLASVSEASAHAPPEALASLRKSLGGERDSVNNCRNLRLMLRKQLPAGVVSISFLASRLCLPCSNQSCSVLGSFWRSSRICFIECASSALGWDGLP